MQHLLTGKKRLPGFGAPALDEGKIPDGFQEMKLNQAFERVQRTTTPDVSDILSIAAKVGFVQQKDKFSRIIAGRNLEKYILTTRHNGLSNIRYLRNQPTRKKLKALEIQKRGLMQKLLTGEVRVKVNDNRGPAEDNS